MDQRRLPKEALDDPYRPPEPARLVQCAKCKSTYISSRMDWRDGAWRCSKTTCNGKGYGLDILDAEDETAYDDELPAFNFDDDDDDDDDDEF